MADPLIPTAVLHRWVIDLWRSAGSNERESALVADHLVAANLSGHDSHGVGMAPRYVQSLLEGDLQLNQTVAIVTDGGSVLTVDGRRGLGQSVGWQAMEIAIERARRHGVCVLGLRNSHHLGRIGHWAEQAAASGLVSIHFTNAVSAPAMVAPYGGAEARFLTNPFTVGIPRPGGEPILLDFATSAIGLGKGESFETEARSFVEWVRSARLSGAIDAILMPGDPERRSRRARAEAVPIDGATLAELDEAARAIARATGRSPGPLSQFAAI